MVAGCEGLLHDLVLPPHVAIGRRLEIHRLTELERPLDGVRTEVEQLFDLPGYLAIAHADMTLAVGIDIDADGLGHADGISELHQYLIADARGNHVLGNVACGISSRAVHLRRILA